MDDIVIIGAGVIGSSVARGLSKYNLKVTVLEKYSDVAVGTSKANSGIVHEGFDAKPGSKKAKYNVLGQQMFDKLSEELDFPFKRSGSLVVCFSEEEEIGLHRLKEQGIKNGLTDLKMLSKDEIKELEPNINENVHSALFAPSGGIVCPYEMTVAFAENAKVNGVDFIFNCLVKNIKKENDIFKIETSKGEFTSKMIINAAGLFSGEINNMVSQNKITVFPRKGEYCLLDKTESKFVNRTIFQLPTKMGKGVLISPTVDGNILIGPTSVDIDDKTDLSTTKTGLEEVINKSSLSVNILPKNKIITSFAGLRARTEADDFIIEEAQGVKKFINLCGIESPGLTAAPAIAVEVENMVVSALNPTKKDNFNPIRDRVIRFREMSNEERKKLIEKDGNFGKIICRCETVTKGEILAALHSPLPATDLDGVKRRTRTGMGRCQTGFCSMKMLDIIAEELNIDVTEVTKFGNNSNVLIEKNKTSL